MTEVMTFGPLVMRFDDTVLRPRPWTIAAATWAAELIGEAQPAKLLELCAGVGHVGLTLATLVPGSLVLVDADENACRYARANAEAAGLGRRVQVRNGKMRLVLAPHERFTCIIADPPWVRSRDVERFPLDPVAAIDGGVDGLDLARICLTVIGRHLADDGVAILQLGDAAQVEAIESYLDSTPVLGLSIQDVRRPDARGVLLRIGNGPHQQ